MLCQNSPLPSQLELDFRAFRAKVQITNELISKSNRHVEHGHAIK